MLHTAIPMAYYTGIYRIFNAQNFTKSIGIGFGIDIFFTLAVIFLQGLNNATLNIESMEKAMAEGPFQSICILIKFIALADLFLEFIMFLYEVYRKHNLSK